MFSLVPGDTKENPQCRQHDHAKNLSIHVSSCPPLRIDMESNASMPDLRSSINFSDSVHGNKLVLYGLYGKPAVDRRCLWSKGTKRLTSPIVGGEWIVREVGSNCHVRTECNRFFVPERHIGSGIHVREVRVRPDVLAIAVSRDVPGAPEVEPLLRLTQVFLHHQAQTSACPAGSSCIRERSRRYGLPASSSRAPVWSLPTVPVLPLRLPSVCRVRPLPTRAAGAASPAVR